MLTSDAHMACMNSYLLMFRAHISSCQFIHLSYENVAECIFEDDIQDSMYWQNLAFLFR